ncbi:MAG: CoA pyrophosphatase [Anaerolineales bacterium]|nr:CoA pyrophosphatase [Anaerolineales bacterium]
MKNLPQKIEFHLSGYSLKIQTEWDARLAAVLIPLFLDDGIWHLLFTRRTDHLESHQGQVSFPGGAVELQDATPQDAALRETEEEIGIPAHQVRVLGTLDPLLTVTRFQIIPTVGIIPWPTELQINRGEVARVFSVPLDWLADERNVEVQQRDFPLGERLIDVYYFKPYQGEIIWGATARLTLNFLSELRSIGYK